MATIDLDEPTLAPAIAAVLAAVRRRLRRYVWLEGCARAVAWLGVAFWATLAVDWLFEPTAAVRGILLAAVATVLAAVLLQLIGRRAFVRITDSNAATVLERRFPQLNDSLLTAVVLTGRRTDQVEVQRELLARTCREAAARAAELDVKKVFNRQPLRQKCVAAGLLALSVAVFAALLPDAFGTWARRTLAFSDELWPRRTRLEVEGFAGGVQKVARGSDLEVVARADATMPLVPQVVEVRYRTDGGGRGRATMDRRGVARGPGDRFQRYAYTFRSVLADIRFDVVGGDDRVRDRRIQVVDSPTISQMTLDCELPAYIGRKEPPLPVSGVMQIPLGSRVTVRAAAANKDLLQVQINSITDDRPAPLKVLNASDLAADRRGFSYALPPLLKDTTLLFGLTDVDGIRGRDPVRLALVPLADQPPQMAVQLDGIGTAVTPRARHSGRRPNYRRLWIGARVVRTWGRSAEAGQPRDPSVFRPAHGFPACQRRLGGERVGSEAGAKADALREGRRSVRPRPRPERRRQRTLAAGRGYAGATAGDAGIARTRVAATLRRDDAGNDRDAGPAGAVGRRPTAGGGQDRRFLRKTCPHRRQGPRTG